MKKPIISKPDQLGNFVKVLVHGPSGAGKTRFASTWEDVILFDIEGGSMSIDADRNVAVVKKDQITVVNLPEYVDWLATADANAYKTVVIDSLTHLQNVFLGERMGDAKDPRIIYGQWQQYLRGLMEKLFSLNKNVIVICRSKMGEDIEGAEKLFPELSPSAFTVIPALVDFAIVVTGKTTGLGLRATTTPMAFTEHPKYWTKTRALMDPEFEPNYEGFKTALGRGKGKANEVRQIVR